MNSNDSATVSVRAEFGGAPESYDRFMGRHAAALAPLLADAADVADGERVLDVGCGTGMLASVLASRVGAGQVAAIDPAERFAAACRERVPGADVRVGVAESLPWANGEFDAALANLVIGFLSDPGQGVREMARVARPGGVVAMSMWDLAGGGMTMLRLFWTAAAAVDPATSGERGLTGGTDGDLRRLLAAARLDQVRDGELIVEVPYAGFDDLWEPFTLGIGPAGSYLASLDSQQQERVRDACRGMVDDGPFTLSAKAWFATGRVPDDAARR